MKAPFDGLTVVELGSFVSAPYCAKLMADLGARVIKVEPLAGDEARAYGPFAGDAPDPDGGGLFLYLNGGKESVVLDLDRAGDRAALDRILARADVFVSNLPVARRRALGLDHAALAPRFPALVVVSLSVFGDSGLWAGRAAEDIQAQAMSGVSWSIGAPDREPLIIPYLQGDFQAGAHGAAAAAMALIARERGGAGQHVDIASADILAAAVGTNALIYIYYGLQRWARAGNRALGSGGPYPYVILPCKDGSVCLIGRARHEWEKLCEAMGRPAWTADPRYQDLHAMGRDYPEEVDALLVPWLMRHTRAELLALAARYSFPLGPLRTMGEVVESPQFAERHFFLDAPHGGAARPIPRPPFRFSRAAMRLARAAPRLGADTHAVLAETAPAAGRVA
ncbi:MAG: CaiB/BaiF CoA transferase family protein [Alphaproteobacteria bacterium]